MSLHSEYIAEKTHDHILETDKGFATYRYLNEGKSVYIIDIYVRPDFRKTGEAASMANHIGAVAKAKGCIEMLGTVNPSEKGSTTSVKVLLSYGMELHSAANNLIVFRKEL